MLMDVYLDVYLFLGRTTPNMSLGHVILELSSSVYLTRFSTGVLN
jgi:hypothetical protein